MRAALPEIPQAVTPQKRARRLPLIWLVPLVAVLAGGWLAVKTILERGPTITISFKTADGLEAGKTRIKYKDVEIGLIRGIALAPDRSRVVATAELSKDAAELLVDDSRFWVVRPRVTASGVSGLGTLLSGAYIAIDPGRAAQKRSDFVALEVPPLVTREERGREFILRANDLGSHDVGVPVYFRRLAVGEVIGRELDKDGNGVSIRIFVEAPYDQYVTTHTRFWSATGLDVALDAGGFRVRTESLVSILIGGIAFQTPPDAGVAPAADANASFNLFGTHAEAMKRPILDTEPFVVVFKQSVRGLSVGAPVDFRGVTVGEVTRIGVVFDPRTVSFVQRVELNVYPDLWWVQSVEGDGAPSAQSWEERVKHVQQFVAKGLRAQVRTGSLLTGRSYVAFEFYPNAPKARFNTARRPLELPTIPGAFEDLEQTIASIAKKLDRIEFEAIGGDVRRSLATLDQTLKSADRLVQRVDSDLVAETRATLQSARLAIERTQSEVIAPDAPLQHDAREALRELARAAEAIRGLADHLERQPESLVRGKQVAP